MSKVKALYHIVFCTKSREMTIPDDYSEDVYRFIWSETKKLNSRLIRVGGIANHIHLLIDLHQSVALADLVQAIKGHSSAWMHKDTRFKNFKGWASEYYACTISPEQQDPVVEYIKNQEIHHSANSFDNEIIGMYRFAELNLDDRDLR